MNEDSIDDIWTTPVRLVNIPLTGPKSIDLTGLYFINNRVTGTIGKLTEEEKLYFGTNVVKIIMDQRNPKDFIIVLKSNVELLEQPQLVGNVTKPGMSAEEGPGGAYQRINDAQLAAGLNASLQDGAATRGDESNAGPQLGHTTALRL